MKRLRVLLSLAAAAALIGAMAGSVDASGSGSSGSIETMGIYRGRDLATTQAVASTNNLTYHGGPVQVTPKVYISYWGSAWATGFSSGGYTSAQAQTYVQDFFNNVGGSKWNGIVTQYCQNTTVGSQTCGSGSTSIVNGAGQLVNTWNDTSSVPRKPRQGDILKAAQRLAAHFGVTPDANVTFMVFTPTHQSMSGFGTSWCAWHSSSGSLAYAYIPYMPDAGRSCGMNFINANNSYGNGYFDGFSVVAGHEYSEAETDPLPSSGWVDGSGSENADKCAWQSSSGNITFGSHVYAVQSTWSNSIAGCPQVPTGL
jgi:hypothetical protein